MDAIMLDDVVFDFLNWKMGTSKLNNSFIRCLRPTTWNGKKSRQLAQISTPWASERPYVDLSFHAHNTCIGTTYFHSRLIVQRPHPKPWTPFVKCTKIMAFNTSMQSRIRSSIHGWHALGCNMQIINVINNNNKSTSSLTCLPTWTNYFKRFYWSRLKKINNNCIYFKTWMMNWFIFFPRFHFQLISLIFQSVDF